MSLRSYLKDHPKLLAVYDGFLILFSEIKWPGLKALFSRGLYYNLKEEDHDKLRGFLKSDYFVILNRRKCHLTSYLIAIVSFFATGKVSHWTHAFMNVEGDIDNNMDYKLIESTSPGVHYSTFMQVFDCDSVVLLKPRGVPIEEWTKVMDAVKADNGKPYDLLFDITDPSQVSCVELVYQGLQKLPNYAEEYKDLIELIHKNNGELTPQMLYDCNDLDVFFECRR